ncbi:hypothetical protein [Leucobacter denitrificans]|uniref:Uncharacterized protein n=1 Tax=Leucobacter denitrificans TaxID=683042 RepID=A0A7G9S413_9MICO|nr:hypothetical protein [Leucobacter denitrificans]QNN62588.1 hypothetical protein H9L06_10155 [Leucobacter denitrificans]
MQTHYDNQIRPAPRTPYHSLGENSTMHIPNWAQHRSVYRSAGRTLYVVETEKYGDARRDLAHLNRAGWDVSVDAAGDNARIAFSRAA